MAAPSSSVPDSGKPAECSGIGCTNAPTAQVHGGIEGSGAESTDSLLARYRYATRSSRRKVTYRDGLLFYWFCDTCGRRMLMALHKDEVGSAVAKEGGVITKTVTWVRDLDAYLLQSTAVEDGARPRTKAAKRAVPRTRGGETARSGVAAGEVGASTRRRGDDAGSQGSGKRGRGGKRRKGG